MLHVGWLENYETTRGGGRLIFFFLLEAGQPASHQSSRAISRTSKTHPSARRKDLQEPIARMHGITAKPSLSRHRAALQLVASGYGQGGGLWLVAKASAAGVVAR